MSDVAAMLVFIGALVLYAVATYYVVRWMFAAQLRNWADHMEPFYKGKFIAGIRYAAAIVGGTAHEPRRLDRATKENNP